MVEFYHVDTDQEPEHVHIKNIASRLGFKEDEESTFLKHLWVHQENTYKRGQGNRKGPKTKIIYKCDTLKPSLSIHYEPQNDSKALEFLFELNNIYRIAEVKDSYRRVIPLTDLIEVTDIKN